MSRLSWTDFYEKLIGLAIAHQTGFFYEGKMKEVLFPMRKMQEETF
jgi:hypothetical protein